jgi:hypothetical protein
VLFRFRRSGAGSALAFNGMSEVPAVTAKKFREIHAMAYVFENVPADRGTIDIDDPREVTWWRKQFGCSEEQLRQAVKAVGCSAAKVEQLLDGSAAISL